MGNAGVRVRATGAATEESPFSRVSSSPAEGPGNFECTGGVFSTGAAAGDHVFARVPVSPVAGAGNPEVTG
jgi:hypothetical protein